jgi:hypothetical protein
MIGSKVRIDARVDYEILDSFRGSGISNPALVAWELVPFSFVADWFVPVGDWLKQLDALLGLTVEGTCTSELLRYHKALLPMPRVSYIDGDYTVEKTASYSSTKDRVVLNRYVSGDAPFAYPPLGTGVSCERLLNAIALLGQAARG